MTESISQTLFRFISLRSPDISEEKEKELRFIYPSKNAKGGVFYAAIPEPESGASVIGKLKEVAASFEGLSREDLIKVNPELFEFSQWLVKNRTSYTNDELQVAMEGLTPVADDTALWDNLFFQFILKKDFYAKETVIHMLKANHVIANFPKGEKLDKNELDKLEKTLIYATVILPNELFAEGTGQVRAKNIKLAFETFPLSEDLKASIASTELLDLENIKEEIEELSTEYHKSYDKALKAAEKIHQEDVKKILDDYNDQLQAANDEWCKDRGDLPYDDLSPCDKPVPVKYPELPEFNFTFTAEIDGKRALAEMSSSTYETVNRLKPIAKIETYAEIKGLLVTEEDRLNTELYQNTTFYKKSVVLNGTILPVSKRVVTDIEKSVYQAAFCSQIRPNQITGDLYWRFFADIASAAESIPPVSVVNTKISQSDGTLIAENNDFLIMASGSDMVKIGLSTGLTSPIITNSSGSLKLESTVTFMDGTSVSFDGILRPNTCGKGVGSDTTTDPVTNDPNFVPTGYGMRQLGVADYRKVEQSVHCYLEGEVSHIENVMAREYKEKSTRRLRRNESTTSTSSETEKEKLTDTTTSNRYEMQNEVSKVLSESQDFSANTSFDASWGKGGASPKFNLGAGTSLATHTSSEDSINQAMTEAQEITERAMDRVVQRVKEERVTKIVEEYEENNTHGFDNRKGDKHVVGVYRWVDKVYKNQIYNYGRRLMYEFAIPQPSKLHRLAMMADEENSSDTTLLKEPMDPRKVKIGIHTISDASKINESNYKILAAIYNAEVSEPPLEEMYVGHAFSYQATEVISNNHERFGENINYELPEGYYTYKAKANWADSVDGPINSTKIIVGGLLITSKNQEENVSKHVGEIPISFSSHQHLSGNSNISILLKVLPEFKRNWQNETFNAILNAYEDQLAEYIAQKGLEEEKVEELKKSNPLFYRQIEQTILRKNCLSYLMDQSPSAERTYGKRFYSGDNLEKHEVTVTEAMDDYASFAKFMEQAFEWEIMSYHFYPFYWANRKEWSDLYSFENNDPLFRSFMQAGLARVVLTVRPGFEKAVLHYMSTGSIWNGGELPVLEDPLYLSIVDELDKPVGIKEGKAWKTQVPTSLTILQADSLGLKVEKALPCNCDDIEDFIEADQTECSSQILNDPTVFNDLQVGNDNSNSTKREIQFRFHNNSGSNYKMIADFDEENAFPLVFKCMDQEITIQRDAAWEAESSAGIIYQKLAMQISLISGVNASQVFDKEGNPLGLQFTVDTDKIEAFMFQKSANNGAIVNESYDILKLTINPDGIIVNQPTLYLQRIEDKYNTALLAEEAGVLLPISRFLL